MDQLVSMFLESLLFITTLLIAWSVMTKDDELNGMRKVALVLLIGWIVYHHYTSSIKLLTLIN